MKALVEGIALVEFVDEVVEESESEIEADETI